jgi:hypothetical protein
MFELKDTTPSWQTANTTELLRRGSMDVPTEPIRFPTAQNTANQIQQIRVSTTPTPISTLRAPRLSNNVPTLPRPVSGIRVSRSPIPGTNNVKVNVHFKRDPSDTAFQSANVYLQQGNGTHSLVGATSSTQTSFVVPKTGASSVVTVQSVGAGTSTPIETSPSRATRLN